MENERFELKHAANTVEMAASRFKMLQIAKKMDRTGNNKKQRKRNPQTIPDPLLLNSPFLTLNFSVLRSQFYWLDPQLRYFNP